MNFKFKKDIYTNNRGGYSRITNLYCRVCSYNFAVYQKDGPGNLRRLYMDRILYPENLTNLDKENINEVKTLCCPNCKEDLGTPYIYKKEDRKAFKVYQDMIIKKVRKLNEN